jgi:sarcosine oxidase, subunit alpha
MDTPARLSPVHGRHTELGARFIEVAAWQVPQAYRSLEQEATTVRERVGVADLSFKGKVTVKGDGAGDLIARTFQLAHLPDGRSLTANNGLISLPLTADEYLLLSPPGGEDEIVRCLVQAGEPGITVVDLTHGLAGFFLAGADSAYVLSKICALPVEAPDFPNGHVAQSSLAKVHATIIRRDHDGLPAFEIYVERPYGEYVWDVIFDAGAELGIAPFGWQLLS